MSLRAGVCGPNRTGAAPAFTPGFSTGPCEYPPRTTSQDGDSRLVAPDVRAARRIRTHGYRCRRLTRRDLGAGPRRKGKLSRSGMAVPRFATKLSGPERERSTSLASAMPPDAGLASPASIDVRSSRETAPRPSRGVPRVNLTAPGADESPRTASRPPWGMVDATFGQPERALIRRQTGPQASWTYPGHGSRHVRPGRRRRSDRRSTPNRGACRCRIRRTASR